jgi:hypothetical protein
MAEGGGFQRWPSVTAVDAMVLLTRLSSNLGVWVDDDLRLDLVDSQSVHFVLPETGDKHQKDAVLRFQTEFAQLGRRGRPSRIKMQVDKEVGLMTILEAAFGLCEMLATSEVRDDAAVINLSERFAVFEGDSDDVTQRLALLAKRARYVEVQTSGVLEQGTMTAAARFQDGPSSGATYRGLVASDLGDGPDTYSVGYATAVGDVYLPQEMKVSKHTIRQLEMVVAGLRRAGVIAASTESLTYAAFAGNRRRVLVLGPEFVPIHELLQRFDSHTPILVEGLELITPLEATRELQERIHDVSFPIGYRIRLVRTGERVRGQKDALSLRDEVERLESQIALMSALGARQQRLLRFTDAQLPALVDVIRSTPRSVIESGEVLYASAHLDGSDFPAHYILYDPSQAALQGYIPEEQWRGLTEDRPISYWLDPYCAQIRATDSTAPMVFAPKGLGIVPSLTHYGAGLKETLRLLIGIDGIEQGARLGHYREPMFIFSPSVEPGFEIGIEVLDASTFVSLTASPRWINDYLSLRASKSIDAKQLARLSESLYQGEVAGYLLEATDTALAAVMERWNQAESSLVRDIDVLTDRLSDELEVYNARLERAIEDLEEASRHIGRLERYVRNADHVLHHGQALIGPLEYQSEQLDTSSQQLAASIVRSVDAAEQVVDHTKRRIEELERRTEALRKWARGSR